VHHGYGFNVRLTRVDSESSRPERARGAAGEAEPLGGWRRIPRTCSSLLSFSSQFRRLCRRTSSLITRADPLRGKPVAPLLNTPRARQYRTVLREAASEGPNFNGHFTVARWGCGTNCLEWAVINLDTGAVWFAQRPALSCWVPNDEKEETVPDWFNMRVGSSLLYLHTCSPGWKGTRTFNRRSVYVWRASGLRLLREEVLPQQPPPNTRLHPAAAVRDRVGLKDSSGRRG
jgi:hypothetical protein